MRERRFSDFGVFGWETEEEGVKRGIGKDSQIIKRECEREKLRYQNQDHKSKETISPLQLDSLAIKSRHMADL